MPSGATNDHPNGNGSGRPRIALLGGQIGTRAAWAVALSASADTTTIGQAESQLPMLVAFRPDVVVVDTQSLPLEAAAFADVLRSHPAWSLVFLWPEAAHHPLRDICQRGPGSVVFPPFDINTVADRAVGLLPRRRPGPADRPRFSRYVVKVIDYFAGRYQTSPSVDALAALAGVSRSQMTHGFRAETGLAVIEYLVALRVRIARELLRETDLKLDHIAHVLGFCDASHFSRVFRACTGWRPGYYRDAVRLGEEAVVGR